MKGSEFDLVVFGATGYTGQIVAEYLAQRHGAGGTLRWAMAGRNLPKLEALREALALPATFPLLTVDSTDELAVDAMCRRTRLCLSTIGPYQLYGSTLVAACARRGVDYVDICGEPIWMRSMIDAHTAEAEASGARILFSCGFDSIPSELSVLALQRLAEQTTGSMLRSVRCRVVSIHGGMSGGTYASMQAAIAASSDPQFAARPRGPFALTPGFQGPEQPDTDQVRYDDRLDMWLTPFMMAKVNGCNVHRSNFLQGHRYGRDFRYEEMIVTGPGAEGEAAARAAQASLWDLSKQAGPQPGEGPSRSEREAGSYELQFFGETDEGVAFRGSFKGTQDPGYGSTAKMMAETALCLLDAGAAVRPGIWTPGAALGMELRERLTSHAGISLDVVATGVADGKPMISAGV